MYKPINGWTKAKILEVMKARPFDQAAIDWNNGACVYLNEQGNKCAVGLFIPDGHQGQKETVGFMGLMEKHTDLRKLMPLPDQGMLILQKIHDSVLSYRAGLFGADAKAAMIDWAEHNILDENS